MNVENECKDCVKDAKVESPVSMVELEEVKTTLK